MKLLYAEDEPALSEAVVDILKFHKYTVDAVYNGTDALDFARSGHYDGIILDIMMPEMSGLDVLKTIRREGINTPVLLLTAKSQTEDKIEGLDSGADDYLAKPFSTGEMLARVRALLRRPQDYIPDTLTCGNMRLDRSTGALCCGEHFVSLSKLEFQVLELLMLNRGQILSTEHILSKIWGYDTDAEIGIVWVYISNLRKHLGNVGADVEIKARRGVGYMLEVKNDQNT